MNENSHTSLVNKNSSTEISQREAATSSSNNRRIADDEPLARRSTYGSFFWFYHFTKTFVIRLANDMIMSFLRYWFPNIVPLPYHLVNLMRAHNNLRAERELHTVTYSSSREQRRLHCSWICLKNSSTHLSHIYLSSEDDVRYQNIKHYEYHDREPIFVIVDSSCVSDPSSNEILVERKQSKDVSKNYFWKNANPIDVPSTSSEFRYEILPPRVNRTESIEELQMVTINLQNENGVDLTDSEVDNESIVISYLRNKDAISEVEGTLMSTKKKASLLESVVKMETILENDQCSTSTMVSEIDILSQCDNNE